MFHQMSDGSVIDDTGKIIYFSCERFVRDICEGDCCFICGASPSEREFNNEHVLPQWILRRYDLIGRTVTLPNDTKFRYDQYKIPCCSSCNSLMGRKIETPISRLIDQGRDAVYREIEKYGALNLFVWLGLIFLKTHLKDKSIQFRSDLREPADPIAGMYAWEDLHHIHTVVRCFYTGCEISREVAGSFWLLPVRMEASEEKFDFGDLYAAQTLLLRLDDIAFLTVFNDSCGAMNGLMPKVERINGAVSEFQLRELMADLAYLNLHLKDRPVYRSVFNAHQELHRIIAVIPEKFELDELDKNVRGALMYHALKHAIPSIQIPGLEHDQFVAAVKEGNWTFLFDDQGEFISQSIVPKDAALADDTNA